MLRISWSGILGIVVILIAMAIFIPLLLEFLFPSPQTREILKKIREGEVEAKEQTKRRLEQTLWDLEAAHQERMRQIEREARRERG